MRDGPLFFGAAGTFRETMGSVAQPPRVLILRMCDLTVMDSTGILAFRQPVRSSHAAGTLVLFRGLRSQPLVATDRAGILDEVGEGSLVVHRDEALGVARRRVEATS